MTRYTADVSSFQPAHRVGWYAGRYNLSLSEAQELEDVTCARSVVVYSTEQIERVEPWDEIGHKTATRVVKRLNKRLQEILGW